MPTVTLIGRTNVGKSTLFNTLVGKRQALISDIPGTTRDRVIGEALWLGQTFTLIDTAGLDVSTEKQIDKESVDHAMRALEHSDLNLLVVDGQVGILPQDRAYAHMLKKLKIPVRVVVNKIDGKKHIPLIAEFEKLGLGEPMGTSGATGSGTGDLLDEILTVIRTKLKPIEIDSELPKLSVAMIGKPNVGKSSLMNALVGEQRAIVSELPHTTRDALAVTTECDLGDQKYAVTFIDTAGIRRKGKLASEIEEMSVDLSMSIIKKADIVLFVLDVADEITSQDKNVAREILDAHKSLVVVANKWDKIEDKDNKSDQKYLGYLQDSLSFLSWAPIVFLSAKTGFNVERLMRLIIDINTKQQLEITPASLDRFLKRIIKKQTPKCAKGIKPPYIHEIRQHKASPQIFYLYADQPENIHFSYMRFINNELRAQYKLDGVGIQVVTMEYKSKEKDPKLEYLRKIKRKTGKRQ